MNVSELGAGYNISLDNLVNCYFISPAEHAGRIAYGVLLLPDKFGFGHEKGCSYMITFADKLAEQGYKVLLLDLSTELTSYHNNPDEQKQTLFHKVQLALDFLREKNHLQRIACLGVGIGAELALSISFANHFLVANNQPLQSDQQNYPKLKFDCTIIFSPTSLGRLPPYNKDDTASSALSESSKPLLPWPHLFLIGNKDRSLVPSEIQFLDSISSKDIRVKLFSGQGFGCFLKHIITEDEATLVISEILDWLVLYLSRLKPAAGTSDGDPWWPQGRNGPFCNVGLHTWVKVRSEWCTPTQIRPSPPPKVDFDTIVDDLTSMNQTFTLPKPMALADLVKAYVEIWESDLT